MWTIKLSDHKFKTQRKSSLGPEAANIICFPFTFQGDFSVPDVPKSMAWCENSICVGFKRDYYLIRVRTGIGTEYVRG